ncbi:MAG TPA: hypothetical protein PKO30_04635 [Prolixibacteraceae bacterium]|nr:hypothetical protein [Prolixibacteraceae bacterium]
MTQNLISANLSAEDAAAVQQNLADAKSRLNFLLSLQTSDIITLFKAGNTYLPFIDKAYQAMVAHPEIIPPVFNKEEFIQDYNLLVALRPIFNQINELAEGIQKTFQAVGSDSLVAALEVYGAVKQNKDKVPGLAATADEMGVFFKRSRAKTPEK